MDGTRHRLFSGMRVKAAVGAVVSGSVAYAGLAIFTAESLPVKGGTLRAVTLSAAQNSEGQQLFDHETFGGNGRTCRTCHSSASGTISPEEVAKRLAANPSDPLFVHDGLDDFVTGTTRIAADATILIERELPEGVTLVDDPAATSVVFARGVPSTVNTPALDPALMYDMRNLELEDQASGAITRHAQAAVAPTAAQLEAIAEFQRTNNGFF
jgi:cytochrome c peroxidase